MTETGSPTKVKSNWSLIFRSWEWLQIIYWLHIVVSDDTDDDGDGVLDGDEDDDGDGVENDDDSDDDGDGVLDVNDEL